MWEKIATIPWKNGDDNSKSPTVEVDKAAKMYRVVSDGSCDADGSTRIGDIDPDSGQSSTSLARTEGRWNGWQGDDGRQFVDSERYPYFVQPLNFKEVTGIEASGGDIAEIKYGNFVVYAVLADQGPKTLIGEMSIRAIEALGGNPWNADKTKIVRGLPHGVTYTVKIGSVNFAKCKSFAEIQSYGISLFGAKPPVEPPKPDLGVTWYEFYRLETAGKVTTGLVGWAGDKPKFAMDAIDSGDFNKIMLENGRHNILVAPANKPWPGRITPPVEPPKPPVEPPKPPTPGTPTLWIPGADTSIKATNMQGNYRKGFPEGAIVHFTAGRDDPRATAQYLSDKFPCLVMGRKGEIVQMFPLSKWGYHSGTPEHEYCVGIEICASGRVEKVSNGFKTWYDLILPADRVRWVDDNANIQAGYYDKYSEEQEAALIKLLLWMKAQAPTIFDFDKVYGHDTVCDMHGQHGRKNDPGGALSMTIPELQKLLKKKYAEITK
jgi:hypothetical protein